MTIEPGTPVIVTINGTYASGGGDGFSWGSVTSATGCEWEFDHDEPAVQVVTIDPDRPTLDREAIAGIVGRLRERTQAIEDHEGDALGDDTYAFDEWALLTDAIKAIQAAHPGLIR